MKRMLWCIPGLLTGMICVISGVFGFADESVLVANAASAETTEAAQAAAQEVEPVAFEQYYCQERRTKIGGWIETGAFANEYGSQAGVENGAGLMNLQNTGWQVQQAWLYAEREAATDSTSLDWGYRVDGMFGTDASQLQSWGDGSFDGGWDLSGDGYGWSIPQAYFSLGYNGWTLKMGKFATPIGYESIMATEQDFFSRSYLYGHEPATHTGVLAEKELSERFSFFGGLTTGADTGFENDYGDFGVLGGFNYQITDKIGIGYGFMWNNVHAGEDRDSYGFWDIATVFADELPMALDAEEVEHSFVLTYDINCRLQYVLHAEYASLDVDGFKNMAGESFGLANYLFYQASDKVRLGVRAEWFKIWSEEMDDARQSCYEIAAGFNYQMTEHLAIRPEVRYDWIFDNGYHGTPGFGRDGMENEQLSGGVAIIASF